MNAHRAWAAFFVLMVLGIVYVSFNNADAMEKCEQFNSFATCYQLLNR